MASLINNEDLPKLHPEQFTTGPIIDVSLLSKHSKHMVVKEIGKACQDFGFFTIINHGISESVIEDALDANSRFFDMPIEEKKKLESYDVFKPVRYGTFIQDVSDNKKFTRDFLKIYANPLEDWIESWPLNPPDYRPKMKAYTTEMRRLSCEIFGGILESLNMESTYWKQKLEQGMHMMGINSYQLESSTRQSNILTGAAPHTDHSIITILLQSSSGLQIMDPDDGIWKVVPEHQGSLLVLVGDHLEIISNGLYKSALHRAIPSSEKRRLSVVSFPSFRVDDVVEPAMELVDENNPKYYKGSSLRDFLNYLASGDSTPFIQTLKIT